MGNEGFDQFMRESHAIKDHHKVILRGSQQVLTENDGQGIGGHMIMLFVNGNNFSKETLQEREKEGIIIGLTQL